MTKSKPSPAGTKKARGDASLVTPELESLHDVIAAELAAAGQRYTTGRQAIIEVLYNFDRPVGMDTIMNSVKDLPQSSAYRSLSILTSLGITRRITGIDEIGHYEISEEFVGAHHHHAICNTCGKVTDIESSAKLERALQEAAVEASTGTGFHFEAHRIDLVGTCDDCIARS